MQGAHRRAPIHSLASIRDEKTTADAKTSRYRSAAGGESENIAGGSLERDIEHSGGHDARWDAGLSQQGSRPKRRKRDSLTLFFLFSKELVRLKDERKAHAFALLAERERSKREAAEAGRRQMEEQRRREHDEMFRQIVKVNQDSVELYLEDIIKEGIEWVSEAQARQYIHDTAEKVDQAACYADEK